MEFVGVELRIGGRSSFREVLYVNVCAKFLIYVFILRFWIRISFGLENLVIRLLYLDLRGLDY